MDYKFRSCIRSARPYAMLVLLSPAAMGFVWLAAFHAGPSFAFEGAECEQQDTARLALRACSSLLLRKDLDPETRNRYLTARGLAWLTEEEPTEAVSDFSQAIEFDSENLRARIGRARAQTQLGNHTLAVEDWTAVLERSENSAEREKHYFERAASWQAAGNPNAAMADYAKVLEINPKSIRAQIGRAQAYTALGDRDGAIKACDIAHEIDPQSDAPFVARAEVAEHWGETRMAIENYATAIRMNPRGAWVARKGLKRLGVDIPP